MGRGQFLLLPMSLRDTEQVGLSILITFLFDLLDIDDQDTKLDREPGFLTNQTQGGEAIQSSEELGRRPQESAGLGLLGFRFIL